MPYYCLPYLVSLAFLAGCHEAPRSAQRPSQPPQPPAATPPAGTPLPATVSPPAPTPAQQGHHRYVGTVKGRRVLVSLDVEPDYPNAQYFHCEGTYYYLNSGQLHALRAEGVWQPTQPLEILTDDGGHWCFTQALGPTLSGVCTSGSGQPLGAISLHESYARAAQYEILTETIHEGRGVRVNGDPDTSSFTRSYLHLLGRDTLRPALARLQCPGPAQRLRGRRKALAAHEGPFTEEGPLVVWLEEDLTVTLNEADLLAYCVEQGVAYGGSGRGYLSHRNYLVDLRTGRPLQLVSQLRPGGLLQLRRLLTLHARRDTAAHLLADYLQGPLLRLPPEGFILQPAGCDAYYGAEDSHDGSSSSFQETISWAELRPLLRPQSPLWRVLQARGL
ncbi:hypothetical protein ACFST9_00260 [Hymenobacter monticola]